MTELNEIVSEISKCGGVCLEVGGCVRDRMLGIVPKDQDIEVYNLPQKTLENILSSFGKICVVGESFGVTKLNTEIGEYDFSLPRRDNKIGKGHKGFRAEIASDLTPQEAATRRDFTINSMGRNLTTGELHDYFGGADDLNNRILRATSEQFVEDPLRVLRGFQFAARFEMKVDPNTAKMCASVKHTFDELPKERIFGEFVKWALKAKKPSMGMQYLIDTEWISCFPELAAIVDTPHDPVFHPEGNVGIHTWLVCDAMADICERENITGDNRIVFMLSALCHDLGKVETTQFIDGRWRSPGHDAASVPLTKSFLKSIGCFPNLIDRIIPLVREHMVHTSMTTPSARSVRRLALRLGDCSIDELLLLVEADNSGRPPLPKVVPDDFKAIHEIAKVLKVEKEKPTPIIMGRHLIELGLKPGPAFKVITERMFQHQLDGVFDTLEEGKAFLIELLDE